MKKNDLASLKKCPLFTGCSEKQLEEILSSKKYGLQLFSRGDTIFSPDNAPRVLAVILKGTAEVSKSTGKGSLYMSELSEGKISGMSCLFNENAAFPTTVKAKENMRVLFIDKQQLMALFSSNPLILENYLSLLSKKICFLNEKIESITATDVKEALKNYLLDTSEKLNTVTFSLPVSVQKLSNLLSVGRTSLYRAFDELTQDGFLIKNGKVITITERK